MFEEIFFPRTAKSNRAAPLAEQRERYLRYLKDIGSSRSTLRKCANNQLSLVRLLDLREGDRVSAARIEAVAAIWSQPQGRRCRHAASPKNRRRFVSSGVRWLRFLGWIDEPEIEWSPHHAEMTIYEDWLRGERGLSDETIRGYGSAAAQFFSWLAVSDALLASVTINDIDAAIAAKKAQGTCNRRSMHDYAQSLRAFFRFAEKRGWCQPGLATGIMPPRFMADETVPKGISREDVLRLLASVQGDRPVDKRNRAILVLLIAYGLRAGEVAGLRLDDLDWENEIIRVRCPKPGRTHVWPLSPDVGDAILRYIREARPTGRGRSLFFTSQAPICPVSRDTLGNMVRARLAGIGIVTGRRGTHALRHAAAQHLLDQGMSMKVIGDFLGHRDPSSTMIYAKVNLAALREVAALDLEGLT